MRAIILAAGEGTRLRPLTDEKPKCLVEYKGRPLLDWQIDALQGAGIRDIVLVKGYRGEVITRQDVRHIDNPSYADTNMVYTLFCAEEYMTDDLLICYADIVYESAIVRALIGSPHDAAVTVDLCWLELWRQRMEDPLADAETLQYDEDMRIYDIGKEPKSYDEIMAQYMGLIKLSAGRIDEIRSFYHGLPRNALYDGKAFEQMYMTTFLREIMGQVCPVYAVPVKGGWLEVDSPSDLEIDWIPFDGCR